MAEGFARCTLRFTGDGPAPREPIPANAEGDRDLRWQWTVPADAGEMRVDAHVACWRERDAAATADADQALEVPLLVTGSENGQGGLVDARGVVVTAEPHRDLRVRWIEVLQVLVTVFGLWFVWRQLKEGRRQGAVARAAALQERYQRRDHLRASTAALRHIRVHNLEQCFDRLVAWREAASSETPLAVNMPGSPEPIPSMSDMRQIMEFWEELATQFHAKAIDHKLTLRVFEGTLVADLDRYWWLIHDVRGGRVAALDSSFGRLKVRRAAAPEAAWETRVYAEWEALAWRVEGPERRREEPAPELPVWIMCLPPGPDDRDVYLKLSNALSCEWRHLVELERALDLRSWSAELSLPKGAPPSQVLCITSWRMALADQRRGLRLAYEINRLITTAKGKPCVQRADALRQRIENARAEASARRLKRR